MKIEQQLYDWLFHYNSYAGQWTAFHKEDHDAYWNGSEPKYPMYKNKLFHKVISQLHHFELDKS